jgi:hypothetical protein
LAEYAFRIGPEPAQIDAEGELRRLDLAPHKLIADDRFVVAGADRLDDGGSCRLQRSFDSRGKDAYAAEHAGLRAAIEPGVDVPREAHRWRPDLRHALSVAAENDHPPAGDVELSLAVTLADQCPVLGTRHLGRGVQTGDVSAESAVRRRQLHCRPEAVLAGRRTRQQVLQAVAGESLQEWAVGIVGLAEQQVRPDRESAPSAERVLQDDPAAGIDGQVLPFRRYQPAVYRPCVDRQRIGGALSRLQQEGPSLEAVEGRMRPEANDPATLAFERGQLGVAGAPRHEAHLVRRAILQSQRLQERGGVQAQQQPSAAGQPLAEVFREAAGQAWW